MYDDIISLPAELPSSHFLYVFREANVDCVCFACTSWHSFSLIGAPANEMLSCTPSVPLFVLVKRLNKDGCIL